MRINFVLLAIFIFNSLFSQTKQSSPIDDIYNSYKNKPKITINNVKGDLSINVYIQLNKKMEPKSIKFSGTTENKEALDMFFQEIRNKRIQEGYNLISKKEDPYYHQLRDYTEEFIYQKGNMYSIISIQSTEIDDPTNYYYPFDQSCMCFSKIKSYNKKRVYDFSVNIKDLYRMNESEGKPIDF
jgi:hypothetical protein